MRKVQSQPLRIEDRHNWSFATSRTIRSELWFVNNMRLENHVLNFLARYRELHGIKLYAFCLMGNHYHSEAKFPNANRAMFYRDLNARIAEGVRFFVDEFESGPVFQGRYSEQAIVHPADLEEYFFYCALQPVNAGLCERISEYPGYNSFIDAIYGRKRKRKYVNWELFNAAKKKDLSAKISDFTTYHILEFERLPGYENLSQKEYTTLMLAQLEERRLKIVHERKAMGLTFLTRADLKKIAPGSKPRSTKKSTRNSKRPLVLTKCLATKQRFLEWYFTIVDAFKKASAQYRAGLVEVSFPPGTYRPLLCIPPPL